MAVNLRTDHKTTHAFFLLSPFSHSAALAGKRAALLHNLTILGSDSTPNNVTRYWLIARHPVLQPDRNLSPKSSFALVMKNQVGALHRVCACFALRDINITKLESRPSSRTINLASPWEYVTYIDIEGAPGNEDNVKRAVENLQEFTQKCIHLGSYPRYGNRKKKGSMTQLRTGGGREEC